MSTKRFALGWIAAASMAVSGCTKSAEDGPMADSIAEARDALGKTTPPPPFCDGEVSWGGMDARVYWPPRGGCGDALDAPLVVILHANGRDFADYDYLLEHLARNGFIAASVQRPSPLAESTPSSAASVEQFVRQFLLTSWEHGDRIDAAAIGLVGHSLGGAVVRTMAENLAGDPDLHVQAVVTLAHNGEDDVFLDGTMTPAYLALHGTNDDDRAPWETHRHFDRAGSQGSQLDGFDNPLALAKGMKLLENGWHYDFADGIGPGPVREVTKGYLLSFFQQHLLGSSATYDDLIRGNGVPPGWSGLQIVSQYRHGGHRRVIDHFEDGSLAYNTLWGWTTPEIAVAEVLDLGDSDIPYPHDTHALRLVADADGQHVRWSIPTTKSDMRFYERLSLRIGQTEGDPATDVFVRLKNGTTWSDPVRLTDHGVIPGPMTMNTGSAPGVPEEASFHHMGTIRIPLSVFEARDNVVSVELSLSGDALDKAFIVDDLEVCQSVLVGL